jgi:hypothetical protein
MCQESFQIVQRKPLAGANRHALSIETAADDGCGIGFGRVRVGLPALDWEVRDLLP